MNSHIVSIVIDLDNHVCDVSRDSSIRIHRRGPSIRRGTVATYPLTARNYWRAVGLQLRLAGFADDPAPWPLDKKNYREDGE